MAVNIRDFNFVPTDNEQLNQMLLELQMTLSDIKRETINMNARIIDELEEV